MDINDVLALVKAGFTAEQIGKMTMAAAPAAEPAPDLPVKNISPEVYNESNPTPPPAPAAEDAPAAPAVDMDAIYTAAAQYVESKFNDMISKFSGAAMPTIPEVKPQGIDDIITNFFKEV